MDAIPIFQRPTAPAGGSTYRNSTVSGGILYELGAPDALRGAPLQSSAPPRPCLVPLSLQDNVLRSDAASSCDMYQ